MNQNCKGKQCFVFLWMTHILCQVYVSLQVLRREIDLFTEQLIGVSLGLLMHWPTAIHQKYTRVDVVMLE